jgi:hypothetical protein
MVMEPMAAEDLEDLLTQAARARRLARATPNDSMGLRLAQVADELDAEIDRQTRIITSSEGIPGVGRLKASAPQSPVRSDRGRDRHIAGSERKKRGGRRQRPLVWPGSFGSFWDSYSYASPSLRGPVVARSCGLAVDAAVGAGQAPLWERHLSRPCRGAGGYGILGFDLSLKVIATAKPAAMVSNCPHPALIVLGPGGL